MVDKDESPEIRSILEEMREEYWQALSEVEEAKEEHQEYVTFVLGGEIFALETVFATEVIRIPRLVKIPRVPDFLAGVFNLRGEITAAMDIRPLLGLPQPGLSASARIIVVKTENLATGIIAEAVEGVQNLPLNGLEPAVKSIDDRHREYIRGQINIDGTIIMMLDMGKLLQSPEIILDQKQ